jgi:hypothetical protein
MPSIEQVQRFVRSGKSRRQEEEDEDEEEDEEEGQTMLEAIDKATRAVKSNAAPKAIHLQLGDKVGSNPNPKPSSTQS